MLTQDEALQRLNISPQSLELLVNSRVVLELNGQGRALYPEVQFNRSGIDARFASLLSFFKELDLSGDQIWSWLNLPLPELQGESALDHFIATESREKLSFVISAHWSIEALIRPGLQRRDWLRGAESRAQKPRAASSSSATKADGGNRGL